MSNDTPLDFNVIFPDPETRYQIRTATWYRIGVAWHQAKHEKERVTFT